VERRAFARTSSSMIEWSITSLFSSLHSRPFSQAVIHNALT
jgi:hypothetical protein